MMTTDKGDSRTPEQVAVDIVSSEPFMWLMVGSNHVELHLSALRPAFDLYRSAGGRSWGASIENGRES